MSAQSQHKAKTILPKSLAVPKSGILQRKCTSCGNHTVAGAECAKCAQKNDADHNRQSSLPPIVNEVLQLPGQPLAATSREFMESRFGYDFSGVRVHTNSKAAESAQSVGALAYTVGNNVVFGAGQFAPQTRGGRQLLAHELTHVIQQGQSTSAFQTSLGSASNTDASEREADAVSRQIDMGEPVSVPKISAVSQLQRKMLNNVVTDFRKGAKACVVHLHGEERTALAVAKEISSRRCVNLVHLDTDQRYIKFEIDVAGKKHTCEADPNRVFTDQGRKKDALNDLGCHLSTGSKGRTETSTDVKNAAVAELESFVKNEWGNKISQCRGGDGSSVRNGELPLLALHNNEGLTLSKFSDAAEKGARLPEDPSKPGKKMPNPALKPGENRSNFFFANQPGDFLELSKSGNAFLQADPLPANADDGSLSVAVSGQRFINVEKEGRKHDKLSDTGNKFRAHDAIYIKNYAMAAQALDILGVPEGACPTATEKVLSGENPAADALDNVTKDKSPGSRKTDDKDKPPTVLPTDAKVLDRDPAPATNPANCSFFENQGTLDTRKAEWQKKLGQMPLIEIVNWIVGSPTPPPADAVQEVSLQRDCMTKAMGESLKSKGLNLPKGNIITSERRTFNDQQKIWKDKFTFKFGTSFGRISDTARLKCQGLVTAGELEWNPKDSSHQQCWKMLTGEEKEKEILMTSSAPGVSRHHAGTDFDFGQTGKDLESDAWTGTGNFADVYRWLARNASRYGFFQPFDTKGGYGKGYTEERWHWSYYPIAQALFEFAQQHQQAIDDELQRHWQDKGKSKEEFEFISKNWRSYIFNVETKVRF